MQKTTAGSQDPQHSGSSLALSDSNSNNSNDDAESKRPVTQLAVASSLDNVKPRCHQCAKTGILCTFFTHSKKRGPIPREELDPEARQAAIDHASGRQIVKPKPTRNIGPLQLTHYGNLRPRFNTLRNFYPLHHSYFGNPNQSDDPMRRLIEEGHSPSIEASNMRPASARGDLWRKELTDHLVEVFFEYCFQDFDNFDPGEFLKDYAEQRVNSSLLNAICAVAARFSDHPDIVQMPPYLSGEPAWSGPRGWRFGGLASRMGIELYLHNQRDVPTLEADRVKFETKCRTFWNLIHIDIFSAASVGLPSILDVKLYNIQLPDYRPDWWIERHQELEAAIIGEVEEEGSDIQETISTQPETTPKDPFASRILTKLQKTRRLRGHGPAKYIFEPIELLFRVSHYINGNTLESDKCPSDPSSEFAVLEGRLSTWIKTIGEEVPLTPKELIESEENVAYIILTYYMTVIMLHRPIIALENVVDTSFIDQSRVRCAEAATKITEIVEQFDEIDIKYRGHLFVFQVFTGAAIHVTHIFSSDDALAANAKRCLNVHLNFLKVSTPHWIASARLYFILQDLYSAQVIVNAKSDSSKVTSPDATPQDRSGSESPSDRASSSGAGHSPISVSLENVHIDHTSNHQDGSDANAALTREWPLIIPPGSTTSSMVSSTTFGDSRSDGASVRRASGIGFDHDEADQGESTTSAGSTTKRLSKKVKKMPPLSRPILLRPFIPGLGAE
ncbi:hypothetical protein EC957_002762 [Mortierella hygrophila]|uniref:Xylanolytic transcriptional activator regulatory domain-containing protein n=1 Tax=Mortierella hygrophila TaxID=979708 RepID=A0A9P6F3P4_9FUNG|nr:hypothetical protein EC957_002762 [Mortierella hygrophila]